MPPKHIIEHGAPYDIEYRISDGDNQIRWMRSVGQVEHNIDGQPVRMRGIVEDITDQVLLRQSLNESENRYHALFSNAGDAILISDLNGKLEEINRMGELLLGYSRDEICQMNIVRIHPADELNKVSQHFKDIAIKGSTEPIDTKILRKDGLVVDIEIRPTLVEIDGRKVVQGIFIDRTECKRLEKERLTNEKAQRDTLVLEVHHRIKNNLQGVTGVLRLFTENHPEIAEPLNLAISQVHGVAVIHGLLGRASLTQVRICELTVAISQGIETLWQKPISVDIPDCWVPCTIAEAEAVPLALILNELIANAVKHGGLGKVRIIIRHEPNPESIRLSIHNTGSIPVEFGVGDASRFGTGLQLTMSLLPREGAKLTWTQEGEIVITLLELDAPVIYLES